MPATPENAPAVQVPIGLMKPHTGAALDVPTPEKAARRGTSFFPTAPGKVAGFDSPRPTYASASAALKTSAVPVVATNTAPGSVLGLFRLKAKGIASLQKSATPAGRIARAAGAACDLIMENAPAGAPGVPKDRVYGSTLPAGKPQYAGVGSVTGLLNRP